MPISMMKHLDEDVPPVFMILDTFDKDVKSLVSLFVWSRSCWAIIGHNLKTWLYGMYAYHLVLISVEAKTKYNLKYDAESPIIISS